MTARSRARRALLWVVGPDPDDIGDGATRSTDLEGSWRERDQRPAPQGSRSLGPMTAAPAMRDRRLFTGPPHKSSMGSMPASRPVIRPASPIDQREGWRWTISASPATSAITLARFEDRVSAEIFLDHLVRDLPLPRRTPSQLTTPQPSDA